MKRKVFQSLEQYTQEVTFADILYPVIKMKCLVEQVGNSHINGVVLKNANNEQVRS